MKNSLGVRSALAVFLLLTLVGAVASGQQEDETPVLEDEVTVTAQRVEQKLQDVPISIIAISADEIQNQAITDIQDLPSVAPGLVVTGQSSSTGEVALTIRGIGSNTFGLGTESTVGYYVDGIYIPRPQGFLNQFLDVERIEVLRGPQGTLWGRNSTGGALNVVTQGPSGVVKGRALLEYGDISGPANGDENRLSFSLSGPFTDKVLGRLSASYNRADDYTLNEALGRAVDNIDGFGMRGSLQFLPSDSTSILLRLDHNDDAAHNNFNLKPGNTSPISTLGTLLSFYGLSDPSDVHRIAANIEPVSEYEESGLSLDITTVLGKSVELQSLSSYREFDSRRISDIDGTTLDFVENAGDFDVDWYSQELKFTGGTDQLEWIAGAYLFHEEGRTEVDTITDLALFEVQFFAANPGLFLFNPTDFCSLGVYAPTSLCGIDYYNAIAPFLGLSQPGNKTTGNFFTTLLETDSYAGYGQLYWHLNDHWTLTGGLRYTRDDKEHSQTTIDFITFEPIVQVEANDWDALTPKVGVEYRPNEDTMVYGSVTTGFKSGGFNSISVQPSFDEETITSYEVGVKSTLAEGLVTLNAAAFHYDYEDLQVAVLFPDRSSVENAASATVDGLELDLWIRPSKKLQFELGASFLDDQFDEFSSQDPLAVAAAQDALNAMGIFDPALLAQAAAAVPASNLSGNGLQRAPDLTANAAVQYSWLFGDAGALSARAQYSYTDDIAFDPFANFVQKSYDLVHANVNYTPSSGNWFLNVYGRNLTDEEYQVAEVFARVTSSLQVWAPPRTFGVQLGFNF